MSMHWGGAGLLIVGSDQDGLTAVRDQLARDCSLQLADDDSGIGQLIQRSHPDLILLETAWSARLGHRLLAQLGEAALGHRIPVLLLGADEHSDAVLDGLAKGAAGHLALPLCLPLARVRIESLLELAHMRASQAERDLLDGLTGIANRDRFMAFLEMTYANACRWKESIALLRFDIDRFDPYVRRHGREAGDQVLLQVGRVLAGARRRPMDLFARYGGDQFVCLLPHTELEGACAVAKLLLTDVLDMQIEHGDSEVSEFITLSVGVAAEVPTPAQDALTLLARAEEGLRCAKQAGRNRVAVG